MIPIDSIAGRRSEINELIASDELSKATKLLMDFTKDFSDDKEALNRVIVIRSSYARLEKRERRGEVSYDEAERRKNQLLFQMLAFLDELEEVFIENSEDLIRG